MTMRAMFRASLAGLVLLVASHGLQAQAPAASAVPAGATGKCNDGSYTTAAKKWQACGGHKGVQSWFADGSAKPASASAQTAASAAQTPAAPTAMKAAPAAASPAAATKSSAGKAARTVAPGGGPGLVWVNTDSKVYHCPGTPSYGTTKTGKYMSEADAKAAGARPNRNIPCSK